MNKYDFDLDVFGENSLTVIIDMLRNETQILEIGSAYGRLTKYLNNTMKCVVDIVEIDYEAGKTASEYARNACIGDIEGDIESDNWFEKLENLRYDYIIFADVLEHLYHPEKVLEKCKKLLKKEGTIIISVPNIAHNAIILNLAQNEFQYNKIGLLDDTHIRFFTYKSLKRMIQRLGYVTVEEKATYKNIEDTEFGINYSMFDKSLTKYLRTRELGNVYQYVFQIQKKENNPEEEFIRKIQLNSEINYEFVCYIKQEKDDDFSENKTIRKLFRPGCNKFEINLSDYNDIEEIRIDPIDTNCIVTIQQICGFKDKEVFPLQIDNINGVKTGENQYLFTTEDPQIYLGKQLKELDKVVICFLFYDFDISKTELYELLYHKLELGNEELKNESLRNEIESLRNEIESLRNEIESLRNEIESLRNENERVKDENNELKIENNNLGTENNKNKILDNQYNDNMKELNFRLQEQEMKCKEKQKEYDILINSRWWRLRSIFKGRYKEV